MKNFDANETKMTKSYYYNTDACLRIANEKANDNNNSSSSTVEVTTTVNNFEPNDTFSRAMSMEHDNITGNESRPDEATQPPAPYWASGGNDRPRRSLGPLALRNIPTNVPPMAFVNGNSVRAVRTRHYSQQQTGLRLDYGTANMHTLPSAGVALVQPGQQQQQQAAGGAAAGVGGGSVSIAAPGGQLVDTSGPERRSSSTATTSSSGASRDKPSSSSGHNTRATRGVGGFGGVVSFLTSVVKGGGGVVGGGNGSQSTATSTTCSSSASMSGSSASSQASSSEAHRHRHQESASGSSYSSLRDYVTNVEYDPGVYSSTDEVIQFMAKRIEAVLRAAKENILNCAELLIPQQMIAKIAAQVIRMAESEPCGLRGCVLYVCLEDEDPSTSSSASSGAKSSLGGDKGRGGVGGGTVSRPSVATRLLGKFAIDPTVVPTFEVFLTLKRASLTLYQSIEKRIRGENKQIVLTEVYLLNSKKLYQQPASAFL